jgi:peptidoglycan hydrolase-like protein with peptidoglycan-binding domain
LPARVAGLLRRRRGATAAAAAVFVVVCLLGGLAAAGVFSGSHGGVTPATAPTGGTPTRATTTQRTQTQPALAAPTATLKPGDQGAAVKVLQRGLAHLGYSAGKIDGQYGPSTVDAVTRFQRAGGLTADGILGPNTLRALARALKNG